MADGDRQLTPRSLLLDVLRAAPPGQPSPVRALTEVGALFGFSSNAIRVTIARLMSRGLLERDERGSYRLSARTLPLNALIEQWRLGDRRMRPWTGGWSAAWQPAGLGSRASRQLARALGYLGFREGLGRLWVRPDNLIATAEALSTRLRSLGLPAGVELFQASGFSPALTTQWRRRLWPRTELQAGYRQSLRRLDASFQRLSAIPLGEALVETIVIGGHAVRRLALDPLLPEELSSGQVRRELTALMTRYDRLGRRLWDRFVKNLELPAVRSRA